MITVSYKQIRQGLFLQTFDRLRMNSNMDAKVSYSISKIASKLDPEIIKSQAKFVEIVKTHAVLDEKGNIAPDKGPGTFKIRPEAMEQFQADCEAYDLTEVTIDREKIKVLELSRAGLAANDWLGLEPILTEEAAPLALV